MTQLRPRDRSPWSKVTVRVGAETMITFFLPHSLVHSSRERAARRLPSSAPSISRDRGDRSGLRGVDWAGKASQRWKQGGSWVSRKSGNWVLLGQSPRWPPCSLRKGSGQNTFFLPGDLEGRGLRSCQVISGLGLPFKTSSHYRQRIISIFRQLHPAFHIITASLQCSLTALSTGHGIRCLGHPSLGVGGYQGHFSKA